MKLVPFEVISSGYNTLVVPIWRVQASSDGISSWTPLKPQHSIPCWLSVQWEPSACRSFNYVGGAYDKFLDFFRIGTFIDSTHMKF